MNISIIVAVSENNVIGKDNKLLWKLRSDLLRFKRITTGGVVIMGQKTMESLPHGYLPNRINIVLTDDPDFASTNIIPAYSIDDALKKAKQYTDEEVFIIGGGSIYSQFIDLADKLYLTKVHVKIDGDTFFPEIDESKWKSTYLEKWTKDSYNEYDYTFGIYTNI